MIDSQVIEKLRGETPGCENKIHLNNAGAGLMPLPVINRMIEHLQLEANIGGYEAAEDKHQEIHEFYIQAGKLLNCPSKNIAYTNNATDSFSRALSSIPFKKGDILLTTNDDYISNQIAFLSFKKRFEINIVRIPNAENGGIDLDQAYQLIGNLNPRLVAVTHVPTNSGLIQPIEQVGRFCKEFGVLYLVDACQSVGQLNVDVRKIGCDFMSVTCRKFLRGPRGTGFLYVSDRILEGNYEPLFIDMQGANWQDKDLYIMQESAQRFEDWEFPYALLLGSKEAIKYALNIGIDKIEDRVRYLAGYLRDNLRDYKKLRLLDRGDDLCGIITLSIKNKTAEEIKVLLDNNNINTSISYREYAVIDFDEKGVDWALRISPHYYNTIEEIDQFISIIKHNS